MELLRLLETVRIPFFDALFSGVTYLGDEIAAIAVILIVLWCFDKRLGYYLLYATVCSVSINQLLKAVFCIPRPWVRDPDFTIVESARAAATGYSFPSGHTANVTTLFGGIARYIRHTGVRIALVALIVLVAFSRMYLGVHTPLDVSVSLCIGIVLVFGVYWLFGRAERSRAAAYVLNGAVLALAVGLALYVELAPAGPDAVPENTLEGVKNAYTVLGLSCGLLTVRWLDKRWIGYDVRAVWWAQLLKCALGVGVLLGLKTLLKAPLFALTGGHACADSLRYYLLVVFGGAVWPLTFRWFARLGNKRGGDPAVQA